jgi:hypothetical protein
MVDVGEPKGTSNINYAIDPCTYPNTWILYQSASTEPRVIV